MNDLEILAKNIQRIRQAMNLSQQALAEKALISRETINRYEKAKMAPNLATVSQIAKALETSVSELFREETPKPSFWTRFKELFKWR